MAINKQSLPLKPCAHSGCTELVKGGGYCTRHTRQNRNIKREHSLERGISAEWHYLYSSARWRKIRAAQLISEPFCRNCASKGIRTKAEDVDHIIPHRGNRQMFYDSSNLQSLCHSCHSRKTIAEQYASPTPGFEKF